MILVTGGCGYKGSVLVPKLLAAGYHVTVLDCQWFGNYLPEHQHCTVLKQSVLGIDNIDLTDIDAIIHLSSIANDPCGELNPKLTWEVSALATMQLIDKARRHHVKQFIYASSGSVYGIKDEEKVIEDLELKPISEYNKTKMVAERVLLSYQDSMAVQIVRPATVCGVSPRMRLDVSVNLLTMQALTTGKINVFGGNQIRPNIHIDDICDVYLFLLENPTITGIYNAGFENMSILNIAESVVKKLDATINIVPSNDPRSYRVDSSKLLDVGFKPNKTVDDAINDIITSFQNGILKDLPQWHNLKWMQQNQLGLDIV